MPPDKKVELVKQNSERIKNMDDAQLKNMVDMMKNNRDYMRQMYKAQGMDMTNEQLDNLSQMMNPDMIKQASQMLSNNPDLIN